MKKITNHELAKKMKFINLLFLNLLLLISFPSISQRQDLRNAERNLKSGEKFWTAYYAAKALIHEDIKGKILIKSRELLDKYLESGFEQGSQIYEKELDKLHNSHVNQQAKQCYIAVNWYNNLSRLDSILNVIPKARLAPNEERLNATISSIEKQNEIFYKNILEIRFDLSEKFIDKAHSLSVYSEEDSIKISLDLYLNALFYDKEKVDDNSKLLSLLGEKIREIDGSWLLDKYAFYLNNLSRSNSHVNITYSTLTLTHLHLRFNYRKNAKFIDSLYESGEELSAWTLFNYGKYLVNMGVEYERTRVNDDSYMKGIKIIEEAATIDNQYASYLADFYMEPDPPPGFGAQKYNPERSRYWATIASLNNKDGNQIPIILGLATGDGIERNIPKAFELATLEMKKLDAGDIGSRKFNDLFFIMVKLCPSQGKCVKDGDNLIDAYEEYTHCNSCDGKGKVVCDNCDGVGYFERRGDDENCRICGSYISRGSGYLRCPVKINTPSPEVVRAL